jgi:purine-nucleoside phosphorylase
VVTPAGLAAAPDPVEVARRLGEKLAVTPELMIVLGSGLSGVAGALRDAVEIPFEDLPGFPAPSVAGHAGRFLGGSVSGRRVLVQAGRFHLYEGHPTDVVCAPVRAAHHLGVRKVIFTNAAGGLGRHLPPGSLMLIEDHVSVGCASPLVGPRRDDEVRAPDMTFPYDRALGALALESAARLGISLARGVYAAVPGPSYETPAEIRALARLGADAVGMSTVPEVVAARALGMSCLAISLITNFASGVGEGALSHEEVTSVGRAAGGRLGALLERIVLDLPA